MEGKFAGALRPGRALLDEGVWVNQDAARPTAGAHTLTQVGSSGRSMRTMPYNRAAGRISTHAMAGTKTRSTGASVRWSGCRAVGPFPSASDEKRRPVHADLFLGSNRDRCLRTPECKPAGTG